MMTLEGALEVAVGALASVVVILWRRDVARSDREANRVEALTQRLLDGDDAP